MGLHKLFFLPVLAWNHHPSSLSLPSGQGYKCEPLCSTLTGASYVCLGLKFIP
jgi:hypothetical protein